MALRWGILSTGRIASSFAKALASSKTGRTTAVASRTLEKANAFGDEHRIRTRYGSYDALLEDPEVDAVYIASPHPMHKEWAIKAAEKGKHLLCEKPLTMNHREAVEVIEAVRAHDVFLMEAFMYRCHPQTAMVISTIREGAIGEVRMIEASFGFHAPYDLEGRVLNSALGGGGILDVGCYPVSMVRLIAGVARGKDFADPEEVEAVGHLGSESGVDEYTAAVFRFPEGVVAQVACGVQCQLENRVRIFGSEGMIFIPVPWGPGLDGSASSIFVKRNMGSQTQEIVINPQAGLFTLEIDTVAANLASRQPPSPAMTWEDTLGNMKTLDLWRQALGLQYEMD